MNRIAIIGCGGAGKTTLARQLTAILAIEATHLDLLFWQAGWIAPPDDEWRQRVEALAAGERWILDGNYGGTMELRLAAADTIIFLDTPRLVCLARVVRRYLRHLNRPRLDRAAGCDEKLDWEFVRYVWNYQNERRPRVLRRLDHYAPGRQIVILRGRRDIEAFLHRLRRERLALP